MTSYSTRDFAFDLPPELIAQQPLDRRDSCKLLHLSRADGRIADRVFSDLPQLLREGDLLVLNDTRVLPCRFFAHRATGGKIEGLFLERDDESRWVVLLKGAGRCKAGEQLSLGDWQLELCEKHPAGRWLLRVSPDDSPENILQSVGVTPLPPYIHRPDKHADPDSKDRQSYQTVYARKSGAAAAPTAGLHFTDALLDQLDEMGVGRCFVTLHVGLGTFLPVKVDRLEDHQMHSEWIEMTAECADQINQAKSAGRRVIAVGTTSVRVLESVAAKFDRACAYSGQTDIFLYPPKPFKITDGLITNFHLPESTLVMLVAAFCQPGGHGGREMILNAYAHAVEQKYRFFSYGDAMFIE